MYPFEKRKEKSFSLHIKEISNFLAKIITKSDGTISHDDHLQIFRNGLAHFNIKVASSSSYNDEISTIGEIEISGITRAGESSEVSCTYCFTEGKLKELITRVLEMIVSNNKHCNDQCLHRNKMNFETLIQQCIPNPPEKITSKK
jgi:hypothetical protein